MKRTHSSKSNLRFNFGKITEIKKMVELWKNPFQVDTIYLWVNLEGLFLEQGRYSLVNIFSNRSCNRLYFFKHYNYHLAAFTIK